MILGFDRSHGFTLIELMCSMAIGMVLLLLAATILGSSSVSYERIGGHVTVECEARSAITQLASDISSARFHRGQVIKHSTTIWSSDTLGFLSLQPAVAQADVSRLGDLCAVYYYLKDCEVGGSTVRCLMRGFYDSSTTFKAIENNKVSSLFVSRDTIDEPVAYGVVAFAVRPESREVSGKWSLWLTNNDIGPDRIQITLVMARRNLSSKLRTGLDWDGGGRTGALLGQPNQCAYHKDLDVYSAYVFYGNKNSH